MNHFAAGAAVGGGIIGLLWWLSRRPKAAPAPSAGVPAPTGTLLSGTGSTVDGGPPPGWTGSWGYSAPPGGYGTPKPYVGPEAPPVDEAARLQFILTEG